MESYAILLPVVGSFIILVVPSRMRYYYTLFITSLLVLVTTVPAAGLFLFPGQPLHIVLGGFPGTLDLTVDSLSAFFILVTNFTMLTGLLYSKGYLHAYAETKSPARMALHEFSYVWLHLSMLAVLMLREGLPFLVSWELMAVSSFMLILFEAEKRLTLKTAVSYMIQMHIGLIILAMAFLLTESATGTMSFDALKSYFTNHSNPGLFFLFFAGFAVKAGFVPFHTWLPEAHPAAPSHVSGVMSGVMIKMGIYGIFRLLTSVQSDFYLIGIIIMLVAVVTGLYGIMMAIVQTDLKKLLAYSTIENVGIIGMGIGLGCMGLGLDSPVMALLGFGGGLMHVLNHSLFKSLLFFSAGSVYQATHTRNMEALGGLIHKMPRTAGLFLFGSMAICALPPLNGFISELLIYYGLFMGLHAGSVYQTISMLLTIIALALIGGFALFGFSKAFGLTFLGSPRSAVCFNEEAVTKGMLFPKLIIAFGILAIGLAPMLVLAPVLKMIGFQFGMGTEPLISSLGYNLSKVSVIGIVLIITVVLVMLLRSRVLRPEKTSTGPTWGCGYTAGTAKQQYTATSYASNFEELASPVFHTNIEFEPIHEEDIFPQKRGFIRKSGDIFGLVTGKITGWAMMALKKIARLQTGNIQHYILYAFIFILTLFILLYLELI
jgi:hydrogenase-4 component B